MFHGARSLHHEFLQNKALRFRGKNSVTMIPDQPQYVSEEMQVSPRDSRHHGECSSFLNTESGISIHLYTGGELFNAYVKSNNEKSEI